MTQTPLRARRPRRSHPIHGRRALTWSALLLSMLFVLAACGNDDGDAATAAAAEATTAPTFDAEDGTDTEGEAVGAADADEDGVADALEDLASDSGSATVTIGDATYEFSLAGTMTIDGTTYVGRCQSLFGIVLGNGFAADGRDITVDVEIPPADWETYEDDRFDPPSVQVEDNVANANWVAGSEFLEGSTVGEYEQNDASASGAATFVNQWSLDAEPVEGTFAIDCEG